MHLARPVAGVTGRRARDAAVAVRQHERAVAHLRGEHARAAGAAAPTRPPAPWCAACAAPRRRRARSASTARRRPIPRRPRAACAVELRGVAQGGADDLDGDARCPVGSRRRAGAVGHHQHAARGHRGARTARPRRTHPRARAGARASWRRSPASRPRPRAATARAARGRAAPAPPARRARARSARRTAADTTRPRAPSPSRWPAWGAGAPVRARRPRPRLRDSLIGRGAASSATGASPAAPTGAGSLTERS